MNARSRGRTALRTLLAAALREDLGAGDVTSRLTVPASARAAARLESRVHGVVSGLEAFAETFRVLDPRVRVTRTVRDGSTIRPGQVLARLAGPARSLLAAERVALNFVQRLSGVATLTRAYVRAAARGSRHAAILDTRKTTPLLRSLEREAVRAGGGRNHRFGLGDAVLIKDNHLRAAWGVGPAVRAARRRRGSVEVEVETLRELDEALAAGADIVLLDNFSVAGLRRAVARVRAHNRLRRAKVLTEASGGVRLATVARIAATGVDHISIGALTHSAPALDLSLEFEAPPA